MFYYVYTDRHGYGKVVIETHNQLNQSTQDLLFRQQENLSPEASLEYASGDWNEWLEDPSDTLAVWNCETAMEHGCKCQCGTH